MVGPVVWSTLATPILPVEGTDGRIHPVYELHVTNSSHFDVRITSVEVLDARENCLTGVNRVFSVDREDVTGKVRPFSLPQQTLEAADYTDQLGPGQGASSISMSLTLRSATCQEASNIALSFRPRFLIKTRKSSQ